MFYLRAENINSHLEFMWRRESFWLNALTLRNDNEEIAFKLNQVKWALSGEFKLKKS